MKINFTRGILLGVGLLGAATVITPAEAAPRSEHRDVKEARKDVKEAKKDVKEERRDYIKADTPREKREAREDLNDAQRNLRNQQQDLRNEKRDLKRPGYNGNYNNGYRPSNNNGYRPNYNNGYRPSYNKGNYNNGYRPGNIKSNNTTLEGRVSNDLKDNGVILRTNNGQNVRVTFSGGEPKQLGTGDVVRVTGRYSGSSFVAYSVNIIRNR